MSDSSEKIWYYATGGQQSGPYTEEEMHKMATKGVIHGQTHVWKSGMSEWLPLEQVPEFAATVPPPQLPGEGDNEQHSHLKLGAGRQFDRISLMDEDPDSRVEITDMLSGQDGVKQQEPRIVQQYKIGFFESFGLNSFEAAFFAVTLIIGGIACAVMMSYWHVIVIALGFLWVIVAGWALIVRAFLKHWAWGLVCLFFFPAQLVYIIVDLKNAYKPLVLMLVGIAAMITPIQTASFQESPVYEQFEVFMKQVQEEIERQQQEMEESRNQKLDQFEEE